MSSLGAAEAAASESSGLSVGGCPERWVRLWAAPRTVYWVEYTYRARDGARKSTRYKVYTPRYTVYFKNTARYRDGPQTHRSVQPGERISRKIYE